MKIKAVFFDAGETLIYRNPPLSSLAAAYLLRAGYRRNRERIEKAFDKCAFDMKEIVRKGKTTDAEKWIIYIKQVMGSLGIYDRVLSTGLREELKKGTSFRRYGDVYGVINALNNKNIRVGVISNAPLELKQIFEKTGISGKIKNVIISEQAGFEKPDRRIFLKGLRKLKVKAHEAVYVGDNFIADIEGSLDAGMVPVWLKRRSKGAHFSYAFNDRGIKVNMIRSLKQLLPLMEKEGWI